MPNDFVSPFGSIIFLIVLWTLPWKGIALWKAARRNDTAWFIVLLVVNSVAILEILYIVFWSERSKRPPAHLDKSKDIG